MVTPTELSAAKRALLEKRLRGEGVNPIGPAVSSPRPADGRLPLSFAQERLWFLYQVDPQSSAYNIPLALTLRGPLAVDVLHRSVNALVARHEALRTVFAA